jgi:hypothetical protein
MGIRAILAKPFAAYVISQRKKWEKNAVETQLNLMKSLLQQASNTVFGKDHKFSEINDYEQFNKIYLSTTTKGLKAMLKG